MEKKMTFDYESLEVTHHDDMRQVDEIVNLIVETVMCKNDKILIALAFQAFLMMVCVAIYAVLVAGIQYSDNLSSSLFGVMAYTVILCYSLFKTASLSKSIFNAH